MINKVEFSRKTIKKLIAIIVVLALSFSGIASQTYAAPSGFKDVSENYWAYDDIKKLTDMNIIKGHTDGTYRLYDEVTRAQSAMFIVRTLGISSKNRPDPGFTDVSQNTTGFAEIATLVDMGVLAKAPKFNPAKSTSRAEMAKMLTLAFELTGTSAQTKQFKDVPINHLFYPYIDKMVANKITKGTSPTLYSPGDKVTRVQIAVFLKRVLDLGKIPAPPKGSSEFPAVPTGETAMMESIFKLVNAERAKAGVSPLKYHETLEVAALVKSKDMSDLDYFSHDSPTYGSPFELMDLAGISYTSAGENIAAGQTTPEKVVGDWMNSPGHRANILKPTYTHMAIGSYKGSGRYGIYHTQMFIKE